MKQWTIFALVGILSLATAMQSGGHPGRSLLGAQNETLQVTMASLIDPGSKIDVCKVDVSLRQSCGDFLGNTLPCTLSPGYRGVVNYTVAQGDTLNVNFNTNTSTAVFMGGAANGGFAAEAPCELQGHLGPAPTQPVANNTITGFTFSPSRAVCPSFVNNTQGTLAVYMFDTANGSVNQTGGDYFASACLFRINLYIQRAADEPLKPDQFYYGQQ